ncbi:MAG: hypothetical protein IJ523_01765 [Succinivibrionaceae bacterium]|nr:hypothetical protein [Succinivibrionaceae bacterium]
MIGRKSEAEILNRLYDSGRTELVVVYGRRRVGKTFLVDETFSGRITFRHTGLSPADTDAKGLLRAQLDHFYHSLVLQGMQPCHKPYSWLEAFFLLEKHLQSIEDGTRQLIFFDELPWLDSPRSGFLRAFEGFWNAWGCHRRNLMVIVCGSANSWILDKLINNHGGLYGRLTYEIRLSPFTLLECEEFFQSRQVKFSRYDIVQSYMIFGGIPYYLGYIDNALSLAQNVDMLFFSRTGALKDEYNRLFDSVFASSESIRSIAGFLHTRNAGYTRNEIAEHLRLSDGGTLSKHLDALLSSDFVVRYVPFGFSRRQEHFKLVDPFCLFYLHFMQGRTDSNENFWQQNFSAPRVVAWRGFAFENVCFNHVGQIKAALGISVVVSSNSAWSKMGDDEEGTQIDMLIQRNDNVINLCEIKYLGDDFVVDKNYYRIMLSRPERLREMVSRKMAIYPTLITTFGLKRNEYSSVFSNVVTMEDLFR